MYTLLKNKFVAIRKVQTCFGCGRKFSKGDLLNYEVGVYDGDFLSIYLCPVCKEFQSKYLEYDDEYGFGDLKNNDDQYCSDDNAWEQVRREIEEDK